MENQLRQVKPSWIPLAILCQAGRVSGLGNLTEGGLDNDRQVD